MSHKDTFFTMNIKGKLLDFSTPKVMGILNISPDSFYDESRYQNPKEALKQAESMLKEGAHILDLGACSTRPGADILSIDEEWMRLKPVLQCIRTTFPNALISIDTFHSEIAQRSILEGADMINDISGGTIDEKMLNTIASLNIPYILMHIKGTPQTMQMQTSYQNLFLELTNYFSQKVAKLREMGVKDIMIDPGFGFGKTIEQNFELFKYLNFWSESLNCPIMVGISRKSMIYKTLKTEANKALNGTSILNTVALMQGAHILRVHDVKEAIEAISMVKSISLT